MSVVVNFENQQTVFVKGSPEVIAQLCVPNTLPINYTHKLQEYTEQGFRVIAIGSKQVNGVSSREEAESNLVFLGFMVMENKLKSISSETIETLNKCGVRTIMATGDNILTAISVGRQCQILKSDQDVLIPQVDNHELKWLDLSQQEVKS